MERPRVTMLVGLGNPGRAYARTRHNVGFAVVDRLAAERGGAWRRRWGAAARVCELPCAEGRELLLVKPVTFMNRSGDAVGPLARKRGIDPGAVVLVYDDFDLPLGRIRVRAGGSAGGHRGVQSVLDRLGTRDVPRIRVGIGRGARGREAVDHVLSRFEPAERAAAEAAVQTAAEAALCMAEEGVETAMNRFNRAAREQQEQEET